MNKENAERILCHYLVEADIKKEEFYQGNYFSDTVIGIQKIIAAGWGNTVCAYVFEQIQCFYDEF